MDLESVIVGKTIYHLAVVTNHNDSLGKIEVRVRGVDKAGFLIGNMVDDGMGAIVPAQSSVAITNHLDRGETWPDWEMPDSFVLEPINNSNGPVWETRLYKGNHQYWELVDPLNNVFFYLDDAYIYSNTKHEFILRFMCHSEVPLAQIYDLWNVPKNAQPAFTKHQGITQIQVRLEEVLKILPKEKKRLPSHLALNGWQHGNALTAANIGSKNDFLEKCSEFNVR